METVPQINPVNLSRAEEDLALARANGFTPEDTLYAVGTPVNSTGVKNFTKSQKEFDDMLPFGEVSEAGESTIAAECRDSVSMNLPDISLDPTGRVIANGLPFTESAFKSLVSRGAFPKYAGEYLSECPPALRAQHFNAFAAQSFTKGKPTEVVLRTRIREGRRENFAATSRIYRPFDADKVCAVMRDAIGPGAKGEFLYDGKRAQLTALFHSPINPADAVCGEFFQAGVMAKCGEADNGGLEIAAFVKRNLCLNLIIIGTSEQKTWTPHVRKDMKSWVDEQLAKAYKRVEGFASKWTEARNTKILDGIYGDAEPKHVFTQLVKQGLVSAPGVKAEELVERCMIAWRVEPGYMKSDIVNAVTRAAHTNSWTNPWASTELEAQGGELLYQQVRIAPFDPNAGTLEIN